MLDRQSSRSANVALLLKIEEGLLEKDQKTGEDVKVMEPVTGDDYSISYCVFSLKPWQPQAIAWTADTLDSVIVPPCWATIQALANRFVPCALLSSCHSTMSNVGGDSVSTIFIHSEIPDQQSVLDRISHLTSAMLTYCR